MGMHEPIDTSMRPTTASLDQRVARVESDVSLLSSRFEDFRTLVRDSLARIEQAVSAPNASDAATTVMLADQSRRISALESENATLKTGHTRLEAEVRTAGNIAKGVGVGGLFTVISLIVFYVVQTGRPI
jgi:hypothetical protein